LPRRQEIIPALASIPAAIETVGRRKGDGGYCAGVRDHHCAPDEAALDHFDMPAAALDLGRADVMVSPQKIAQALQMLAESTV
jgi:hypothetical protein